jgi:hypothetical protein
VRQFQAKAPGAQVIHMRILLERLSAAISAAHYDGIRHLDSGIDAPVRLRHSACGWRAFLEINELIYCDG